MKEMDRSGEWNSFKNDWVTPSLATSQSASGSAAEVNIEAVWSVWSKKFTQDISNSKDVESVIALGSLLAIALHDEKAGYSSAAASGLQKRMLEGGPQFNVHSRVLGNVFYLMASQTSKRETLREIERMLGEALL
jgi:dethiobiotin synthetase/adenosylmethionine--8-amino-7-oxononanoate aminotransferase